MFIRRAAQRIPFTSSRSYTNVLNSLSKNVVDADYAVRGPIPLLGEQISKQLAAEKAAGKPLSYPFSEVTALNIGNPQRIGQGSVDFNREVMAGMVHPALLEKDVLSEDAKNRCRTFLENNKSPVGAYTGNSKGWEYVRKTVSNFINERDGLSDSNSDNVYLTNGASEGVRLAFTELIRNPNDGILVPIPQYPLYSAQLTLNAGQLLPYYLDEEKGWSLNVEDMETIVRKSLKNGITPRAIVVINPGNPTGQVLSYKNIEDIIRLCHHYSILIMADEVYQSNIYVDNKKFISVRQVLNEMGGPYKEEVELLSLHSISKGLLGECGLRGGYLETHNLSKRSQEMTYKLKSIELCSNTIGQLGVDLMVDPPKRGRESDACVDHYQKQTGDIMKGLRERAELLSSALNDMENVTCTKIEGAMYGFPQVHFS